MIKDLLPIFAAVIGLTPVVLKWINDRSAAAAMRQATQHAKEQVEFWRVWLEAQREVVTDERFSELKQSVAQRLDELLASVSGPAAAEIRSNDQGPHLTQRLFLAYFPHTAAGWLVHTFFYLLLAFAAVLVLGSTINDSGSFSWTYFRGELVWLVPTLMVLAIPGFILQRIANRAESRYQEERRSQT